jgi:cyclic pyranopterin monophosphate synthase
VGVGSKQPTLRRAEALSRIVMNTEAFERVSQANAPKGDVLATARVAAIMAAKRTSELIPLCHPLSLTKVDVQLSLDEGARAVHVEVAVECFDRTGVEMEALTAASVASLTIYDMLKAFDRSMVIGPTRLVQKSGGRSGDYTA